LQKIVRADSPVFLNAAVKRLRTAVASNKQIIILIMVRISRLVELKFLAAFLYI